MTQDRMCQEFLAAIVGCGKQRVHGKVNNEQDTELLTVVLLWDRNPV